MITYKFEQIQIGDQVAVRYWKGWSKHPLQKGTVTNVTKVYFDVAFSDNVIRFRKEDGKEKDKGGGYQAYPFDEVREQYHYELAERMAENLRNEIAEGLKKCNDLGILESIKALLEK